LAVERFARFCAKMLYQKLKRRVRRWNTREGFQISKRPVVCVDADETVSDAGESIELPHERGTRILFAIARDSRTICATWNIDWASLFETVIPVDRQVHLRVYGADGIEEKTVAVEPMAAMHYVTTSGPHAWYRVEIGYYESADVWHSVAMSEEIMMPPTGISETADVDLATIPFHVAFQQLLELFKPPSHTALAAVISQLEKRLLSSEAPKLLSPKDKEILLDFAMSASDIKAMWRAFDQPGTKKLMRCTGALLAFGTSSPSRGVYR
jgi:hypothetical protein